LTDWKLDTRDAQRTRDNEKTTLETGRRTAQQKFVEDIGATNRKGNEKYPDYQEKLDNMPDAVMHVGLASAVLKTSEPSDIAYYLATNPQDAERISKLDPASMLVEVVRLEAKAVIPVPPKKKTNAPPPVKPLGGNEKAGGEPDPKTDPQGWVNWERARNKARGRLY
jgi:hypothetical protein